MTGGPLAAPARGPRVFLSYARADAERAHALARLIGAAGADVWFDRAIAGGASFSEEIERELARADAVIVLWSAASVRSNWVLDEAAAGRDTGRLLPATLDGTPPPLGFRQFQVLDFSGWHPGTHDAAVRATLDEALRRFPPRDDAIGAHATPVPATSVPATPVPATPAPSRSPRRISSFLRRGLLPGIVAIALIWWFEHRSSGPPGPSGIPAFAIAPFRAVGGGPDLAALAERTTEAAREAMPAQRFAARILPGERDRFAEAAAAGAPYVMTGAVRASAGGSATIAARIENVADHSPMWSIEMTGAPATLARQVADRVDYAINCAWDGQQATPRPADVAALLLPACDDYNGFGDFNAVTAAFRAAAARAPEDGYTHALLSTALAYATDGAPETLLPGLRGEAMREANRALALNPHLGAPYIALGTMAEITRDYAGAEALYRRGIAADPNNPHPLDALAKLLGTVGRLEEALIYAQRALALQRGYITHVENVAVFLDDNGATPDALAELDTATEPERLWAIRLKILLGRKDFVRARAVLDAATAKPELAEPGGIAKRRLQLAAVAAPNGPEADRLAGDALAAVSRSEGRAANAFFILTLIGRTDAALQMAIAHPISPDLLFGPPARAVLFSPRFPEVARRQALWTYWQKTGRWPDICRDKALPWRCA